MDALLVGAGTVLMLLGVFGVFFAASGKAALSGPATRFFFAIRGNTEPSRAYIVLSSSVLVGLGVYMLSAVLFPGLPGWLSVGTLLSVFVLQLAANYKQHDA